MEARITGIPHFGNGKLYILGKGLNSFSVVLLCAENQNETSHVTPLPHLDPMNEGRRRQTCLWEMSWRKKETLLKKRREKVMLPLCGFHLGHFLVKERPFGIKLNEEHPFIS